MFKTFLTAIWENKTMKELRFYKKNVYGVEKIYPVDTIKSEISILTGRRTVDEQHLQALVDLGFTVLVDEGKFQATYF